MVSLAAQKFIADIANEVMQKQKANQAAHQHRMKTKVCVCVLNVCVHACALKCACMRAR